MALSKSSACMRGAQAHQHKRRPKQAAPAAQWSRYRPIHQLRQFASSPSFAKAKRSSLRSHINYKTARHSGLSTHYRVPCFGDQWFRDAPTSLNRWSRLQSGTYYLSSNLSISQRYCKVYNMAISSILFNSRSDY